MSGRPWPAGQYRESRRKCGTAATTLPPAWAKLLRRLRFMGWIPGAFGTFRDLGQGGERLAAELAKVRERKPSRMPKPGEPGYPSYRRLGVLFGVSAMQARRICKGLRRLG